MRPECKEVIYQRELDTILRFGALLNCSLKIEEVLDTAMKWAEEFVGAEASAIYELDEEKEVLFIRQIRGEKASPPKEMTLRLGEGIAGRVAQTAKPMVIQSVKEEERFRDIFDRATGFHTRALICVPLISKNTPIGVLQVFNKQSNEPFTEADLELLIGMSQQIAVAMENAKLYRQLEENFDRTSRELQFAQERLIRAGRLAALGHLAEGVAHEIRNPVTTIGGFARRIRERLGPDCDIQTYLDIILEESARLEQLVEKVHRFTEIQSAHLTQQPLGPLLEEVLEAYGAKARELGIQVRSSLPPVDRLLPMDRGQIFTALANIIENAIESMDSGGTLTLELKEEEQTVSISVSDTGCGISEDQMDAVFDPFITSKNHRVGLGLTTVHQIVMNHHGAIDVRSEPPKGTTVVIQLPLETKPNLQESR